MSENDFASLLDRIERLEDRVERIESILGRIEEALLGKDPIGSPGHGLLIQHHECAQMVKTMGEKIVVLEKETSELVDYKKQIATYSAGIVLLITVAWELFTHFVKF